MLLMVGTLITASTAVPAPATAASRYVQAHGLLAPAIVAAFALACAVGYWRTQRSVARKAARLQAQIAQRLRVASALNEAFQQSLQLPGQRLDTLQQALPADSRAELDQAFSQARTMAEQSHRQLLALSADGICGHHVQQAEANPLDDK